MHYPFSRIAVLLAGLSFVTGPVGAGDLSGEVELTGRNFFEPAADKRQYTGDAYLRVKLEYYHDWNDGDTRFVFTPVGRVLQGEDDYSRADGDVEELYLRHTIGDNDLYAGYRKLFWGVTESVHLVDVINQVDQVEDIDAEDRLGQLMVQWSSLQDWGTIDVIVMPEFRERRFPEVEGRLRPLLPIVDDPPYESDDEDRHVDAAVRWSHFIGDWDVGVAHFSGTSREPLYLPVVDPQLGPALQAYYPLLDQTSIDLQATKGGWLWKLEVASREQLDQRSTRLAGGFEYSFYGLLGSDADLGVIVEYLFDDMHEQAGTPFEDDIFVGARIAFNDVQGSELLAGVIVDREDSGRVWSMEASRRLFDSWKLSLTARFFSEPDPTEILYSLRRDDFVAISLAKYF